MALNLSWISWAIIGVLALWLGFTLYLKKLGQDDLAPEAAVPLLDGCPVASAMGQGKHR